MHRIVVIPLAAPDEAVLFEDGDDLVGHAVLVRVGASRVGLGPLPIVALIRIDVDRVAVPVRTDPCRAGDDATIVGAGIRLEIFQERVG